MSYIEQLNLREIFLGYFAIAIYIDHHEDVLDSTNKYSDSKDKDYT